METTAFFPLNSPRVPQGLKALVALVCVVGALSAGYRTVLMPVTLVVDGQVQRLRTSQDTVAALVMDAGLTLRSEDIVTPALEAPLEPGLTV
jgi:uncharacterized protein YabE (DUF348 family)